MLRMMTPPGHRVHQAFGDEDVRIAGFGFGHVIHDHQKKTIKITDVAGTLVGPPGHWVHHVVHGAVRIPGTKFPMLQIHTFKNTLQLFC